MPNPTQPFSAPLQQDDEISLWELWQILVQRKGLILACFVICLAGGAAFAFLKAPVYEANIKVRIGQVGSVGLLEPAEELSTRILAQYGEGIADGIKRDRPFITKANVQKGVITTLQLTAEADTPADAAGLLQDLVGDIQKTHAAVYEENIKPISDRLKSLDEQRQALQQQYADITQLFGQLKERDSVQASLIMLERGPITNAINEQDTQRLQLTQQLTPPQTRPTELVGEIIAPAKPFKPKKALVLALAAVLGIMAGVMLAFMQAYAQNARLRKVEAVHSVF